MLLNQKMVTVHGDSLKGNYLNDDIDRDVLVFYPDKIVDGAPLLIELAGLNGTPKLHNRFSEILNSLYKKNLLGNSIIINPNFSTKYHVNQYINSPAVGNYEDFIINDLIPQISDMFHTGKVALFGKSSGGFGAYTLAVRHPDIISGFANHFGDSCFEYVYIPDIPIAFKELRNKKLNEYIKEVSLKDDLTDNDIRTLNIIGMSAFYSYNENTDLKLELPFDLETGGFNNDVWQRWLKFDPSKNVDNYISELKKLDAIYLDVGIKDEYSLFIGMNVLHKKMEKYGVNHIFEEFNGGHFGNSKRYEKSLPYLVNRLSL
ncbi:alpha/beta hydrolase-fold protein [Acidiplasma sp.]|uniref:alpha/beta hydrolase-fold protein n=1 Tax=Acidiplasma sp. TaxID=1872114 RepID=UPI00315E861D